MIQWPRNLPGQRKTGWGLCAVPARQPAGASDITPFPAPRAGGDGPSSLPSGSSLSGLSRPAVGEAVDQLPPTPPGQQHEAPPPEEGLCVLGEGWLALRPLSPRRDGCSWGQGWGRFLVKHLPSNPGRRWRSPSVCRVPWCKPQRGQRERREGTVSLGREVSIQEEAGLGSSHGVSF